MVDNMINLAGNMPPEMMAEQQQLNRQQRLADLLTQQGLQQMPAGSMVSGRYVPTSPFQHLAQIANIAAGQYVGKKGDEEAIKMAQKLRQQYATEAEQYQKLRKGTSAQEGGIQGPNGQMTTQTTADMYGADMSLNPQYKQIAPVAATLPNSQAANLYGANAYDPVLREFARKEMFKLPKWEKAEYTDEKTGKTRQGVINVNSDDPISTFQVGGVKPEMTAYERATLNMRGAELADQGIGGYGAPSGNQPSSQPLSYPTGQGGSVPVGQTSSNVQGQVTTKPVNDPYAPNTMPVYQYDRSLSPKQNREQAAEFSKENQKLIKNAKNSFDLLKATAETLATGKPSSGGIENFFTYIGEQAGYSSEASKADAALKIFGEKLTSLVPRFEGPQSDKDTASYRIAAGDVGNPNKPIATRMAAVQTMIGLAKKYYPNGDWNSINTGIAGSENKVSLGDSGRATAPAGIDPAVWAVMTPQEKSLWQKQ